MKEIIFKLLLTLWDIFNPQPVKGKESIELLKGLFEEMGNPFPRDIIVRTYTRLLWGVPIENQKLTHLISISNNEKLPLETVTKMYKHAHSNLDWHEDRFVLNSTMKEAEASLKWGTWVAIFSQLLNFIFLINSLRRDYAAIHIYDFYFFFGYSIFIGILLIASGTGDAKHQAAKKFVMLSTNVLKKNGLSPT